MHLWLLEVLRGGIRAKTTGQICNDFQDRAFGQPSPKQDLSASGSEIESIVV